MAGNGLYFTCERIGHAVIHMKKYTAALDILLFSCEKVGDCVVNRRHCVACLY